MFNTYFNTDIKSNGELDNLLDKLENVDYHTFYRAYVVNNQDSLNLGRVQVRIPALHGFNSSNTNYVPSSSLPWATPAIFSGAGNDSGSYLVPNVGDTIFVTFENNSPTTPIYFGGILSKEGNTTKSISSNNINNNKVYKYKDDDLAKDIEHNTERIVYKSLKGATIIIDDYDEEEYIKIVDQSGQEVSMQNYSDSLNRRGNKYGLSERSKITMTNAQGDKITLKNGKTYIQSDSLVIESNNIDIPGYNRDFEQEASLVDLINGESVIDYDNLTDSNVMKYQKEVNKILGTPAYTAYNKNMVNRALYLLSKLLGKEINAEEQIDYSDEIIAMSVGLTETLLSE